MAQDSLNIGSLHLHIDAGPKIASIRRHLDFLDRHHTKQWKLTRIIASKAGPQQSSASRTFAMHTPALSDQNPAGCFATIQLCDRAEGIRLLNRLLPRLTADEPVVIEFERVVARIHGGRRPPSAPIGEVDRVVPSEVPKSPLRTLPVEIHHSLDLPWKAGATRPMDLAELLDLSLKLGIELGGWFLFKKPGIWAYRSSLFRYRPKVVSIAEAQHDLLANEILSRFEDCKLSTTVEEVLGIWNSTVS